MNPRLLAFVGIAGWSAAFAGSFGAGPGRDAAFPLGFWIVPQEKLETVADAGFNTVLYCVGLGVNDSGGRRFLKVGAEELGIVRAYLDEAHRCGVKVVVALNFLVSAPGWEKRPLPKVDLSEPMKVVSAVKQHPAALAWYPLDEPEARRVAPAFVARVCRELRALDRTRPILMSLHTPQKAKPYARFLDWVGFHSYPITRQRPSVLPLAADADAIRGIAEGRPVIATLQCFYDRLRRMPTMAELRCMTYTAIVHGASGILYFDFRWQHKKAPSPDAPGLKGPGVYDWDDVFPGLWPQFAALAQEIKRLGPALAGQRAWQRLSAEPRDVHAAFRPLGKKGLLIVVNTSGASVRAAVRGLPRTARKAKEVFGEDVRSLQAGQTVVDLLPLGVRVYEVKLLANG